LGQFFKIPPNLKQYFTTKFSLGRRTITPSRPNPIITLVAIDPHMVVIQIQVGKNMVENVLLDGGSSVNITTKELWKWLGLPNLKPTSYTLWMAYQTNIKPIGLIKDLKIHIHGIP